MDTMRLHSDPHRWKREQTFHDLKPADIAKTLFSFAKIKSQRSEFPQQTHIILRLLKQAGTVAQTFAAKDIALFFKAIAILQHYPDPHLLQALSKRATLCAKKFQPADMADLFWAFPTLGLHMDRDLFAALAFRIHSTFDSSHAPPQAFAGKMGVNVLWGIACMQYQRELGLIHALCTKIHDYQELLVPMDVGLVVWSFSALDVAKLPGIQAITQDLVELTLGKRVNEFGPVDLSSLCRSLVLCGYDASNDDVKAICARAYMIIQSFEAQATAMFLWSMAMLKGSFDNRLREEMKARVTSNASLFSFEEMSDVIWACFSLDIQIDPAMWTNMWKRAQTVLCECDGTSLSNFMFAHAVWMKKPEQALLDALKEKAAEFGTVQPPLEPNAMGNLVWAFGALGIEMPQGHEKPTIPPLKWPCFLINSKQPLMSIEQLKSVWKPPLQERQMMFV